MKKEFYQLDLDATRLIVFDWDGTLANSLASILNSFRTSALRMDLDPVDDSAIKPLIGLGLKTVINSLYPNLKTDRVEAFAHYYQEAYFKQPKCTLFEGVAELLEALKQKGVLMAVATGKGRQGLNQALVDTNVKDYFFETKTVNECPIKPDPTMLNEILEAADLDPTKAIMVGDAICDMEMAQSIGMNSVGVLSGGGQLVDLQKAGANSVINSVCEIII